MSRRSALWLMLGGLAVLVALFAGWRMWQPGKTDPDMAKVMELNTRGVGYMDQFEYEKAAREFEAVVRIAPDWTPGHINLGIALLNQDKPEKIDRAIEEFRSVLSREPDNPHANYLLGFLLAYYKEFDKSIPHFEKVTRIDPSDAGAWYQLGYVLTQYRQLHPEDPALEKRADECFERAYQLNPYMTGVRSNLMSRVDDPRRQQALKDEDDRFRATNTAETNSLKYTEQGSKYARAIARPEGMPVEPVELSETPFFVGVDRFEVRLAPGANWAGPSHLGDGPVGELRRLVRRRFGATMVTLDFNRDGRPDLFLVGAVVEGGKLRDLLLRNDGGGAFTDVTAAAGLGGERPGLGCAAVDFDNDNFPDLLITGAGAQVLFRNTGDGTFEDVSAQAGLGQVRDVCLGCAWVDLDQDGDLDLLLARYAGNAAEAAAAVNGRGEGRGGIAVLVNNGKAKPVPAGASFGALSVDFFRSPPLEVTLQGVAAVVGFAVTDADGDTDMDAIILADRAPAALAVNDRLLRFHRATLDAIPGGRSWCGVLALDVDQDERTDLLILPDGTAPDLLLNRSVAGKDAAKLYERDHTGAPPLRQARVADLDLDGWPDVVGVSSEGRLAVLRNNRKGGFAVVSEPGVMGLTLTQDLVACLPLDLDGHGSPDVLAWNETTGLQAWRNKGREGRHALKLRLVGRRENASPPGERVNSEGIGARVTVQVGGHWTTAEHATASAGLGQSSGPLLFGLGTAKDADAVVRLRWPDMVVQAEFLNDPKGQECSVEKENIREIREKNRKPTSCPLLLTWDGAKWVYVGDFLGEGSVGEMQAGGGTRVARPEESVKIEAHQLRPRDGAYVVRVAEPMDEITLLDRLRLDVIDLPPGVDMFPDERFATSDPPPTQERLFFRERFFARRATDQRGRDVTETLRRRDRKFVDGFDYRSWVGFAGDHWVELDFGEPLRGVGAKDRLFLVLAGWTDYPFPESIFAAKQAGVAVEAPVLERQGPDGRWVKVCDIGFPAGTPRVMTRDVTGLLAGHAGKLRLRTNMQIYWDQIFLAPAISLPQARVTELDVAGAELGYRGMLSEVREKGSALVDYDPLRVEPVPVTRWKGFLTRYGDVTELLAGTDDRVVIIGPGDEATVSFDASKLPSLPAGWSRQFILRTWGWCKDAAPFTATGGAVGPLPFRAMKQFPPGPAERYPYADDLRKWHTRRPR